MPLRVVDLALSLAAITIGTPIPKPLLPVEIDVPASLVAPPETWPSLVVPSPELLESPDFDAQAAELLDGRGICHGVIRVDRSQRGGGTRQALHDRVITLAVGIGQRILAERH